MAASRTARWHAPLSRAPPPGPCRRPPVKHADPALAAPRPAPCAIADTTCSTHLSRSADRAITGRQSFLRRIRSASLSALTTRVSSGAHSAVATQGPSDSTPQIRTGSGTIMAAAAAIGGHGRRGPARSQRPDQLNLHSGQRWPSAFDIAASTSRHAGGRASREQPGPSSFRLRPPPAWYIGGNPPSAASARSADARTTAFSLLADTTTAGPEPGCPPALAGVA